MAEITKLKDTGKACNARQLKYMLFGTFNNMETQSFFILKVQLKIISVSRQGSEIGEFFFPKKISNQAVGKIFLEKRIPQAHIPVGSQKSFSIVLSK